MTGPARGADGAATPDGAATDMEQVEAIKQLKARYFRLLDAKDWAGFRQLFTEDVVIDTTESGGGVVTGAAEFVAFLEQTLAGAVTVHQGHMPEIQLTSPTTATGIWALQDRIIWPDGTRLEGFGHYHEVYERLGDGWRIKRSTLTRLHMELAGPDGASPS